MTARARLRVRVEGIVQGVGFRPFVHALATRHRLGGFVGNDTEGVFIEVEGAPEDLRRSPTPPWGGPSGWSGPRSRSPGRPTTPRPSPSGRPRSSSARGLSKEEAAKQLGVSVKTVSRWVGGEMEPRFRDLRRIRGLRGRPVPLSHGSHPARAGGRA